MGRQGQKSPLESNQETTPAAMTTPATIRTSPAARARCVGAGEHAAGPGALGVAEWIRVLCCWLSSRRLPVLLWFSVTCRLEHPRNRRTT